MPKIKNWSKLDRKMQRGQVAGWEHQSGSLVVVTKASDKMMKKYNITEPYEVEVFGRGSENVAGSEEIGSYTTKSGAMKSARGYMKRNTSRVSMPR